MQYFWPWTRTWVGGSRRVSSCTRCTSMRRWTHRPASRWGKLRQRPASQCTDICTAIRNRRRFPSWRSRSPPARVQSSRSTWQRWRRRRTCPGTAAPWWVSTDWVRIQWHGKCKTDCKQTRNPGWAHRLWWMLRPCRCGLRRVDYGTRSWIIGRGLTFLFIIRVIRNYLIMLYLDSRNVGDFWSGYEYNREKYTKFIKYDYGLNKNSANNYVTYRF